MAASMKSVTEAGAELSNEVRAWLNLSSYFLFLGKEFALCRLQECGRGKAELMEGRSFNCEDVFQN